MEERMKKNFLILIAIPLVILLTTATVLAEHPSAEPGDTIPVPVYPALEQIVYTRTPTFRFSEVTGATKYRVQVLDAAYQPNVLVYTFKGKNNCSGGECSLTPDTPLKFYDYSAHKGIYNWRVAARVGDQWTSDSEYVFFLVVSPGFNSQFTTDMKKWTPISGTWSIVSPGYLKTKGKSNSYSSVMQKHLFAYNLEYEVRMKLKAADVDTNAGIIVNGAPGSLGEMDAWGSGYYILFNNSQQIGVWKRINDEWYMYYGFFFTPLLNADDWNTLKVIVEGDDLNIYINGTWWNTISDSTMEPAFVGLTFFKDSIGTDKLLVDWAKVTVDTDY